MYTHDPHALFDLLSEQTDYSRPVCAVCVAAVTYRRVIAETRRLDAARRPVTFAMSAASSPATDTVVQLTSHARSPTLTALEPVSVVTAAAAAAPQPASMS